MHGFLKKCYHRSFSLYLFQTYEQGKNLKRIHYMSNITTALKVLDARKVKLVNINPSDVVDGKPSIVLGLCWTIILYFQVS